MQINQKPSFTYIKVSFCVSCLFKTLAIMVLHHFLCFVVLGYIFLFIALRTPCSTIHLHKPVRRKQANLPVSVAFNISFVECQICQALFRHTPPKFQLAISDSRYKQRFFFFNFWDAELSLFIVLSSPNLRLADLGNLKDTVDKTLC